jgi:hypothetical protein
MTDKVRTEMNALENEGINKFFKASVEDLTPTGLHRETSILFMPSQHGGPAAESFGSVLSVAELSRAKRFKVIGHKMRFLQRRAFRRFCGAIALGVARPLSQVDFAETKKGRPYLFELPRTSKILNSLSQRLKWQATISRGTSWIRYVRRQSTNAGNFFCDYGHLKRRA